MLLDHQEGSILDIHRLMVVRGGEDQETKEKGAANWSLNPFNQKLWIFVQVTSCIEDREGSENCAKVNLFHYLMKSIPFRFGYWVGPELFKNF